uniref:Putative synaptic vesicle transporter svop n=1 Tax=Amblyomma aureolatum TaxID=187763 RepID=A0A1E1XAJ8_9ACAR
MTEVVDLIGHFGPWQACFVVYVTYRGIITGLNNLAYVFLVTDNEHWCSRPSSSRSLTAGLLKNLTEVEWRERFIPYDSASHSHSQCSMYEVLHNATSGELVPDNTSLKSCESWTYDEHVFGHTATDEWNLVCEHTWKRSLIQSTYMAFLMLGILIIGNISDRFGRRIVALGCTVLLCVSSSAMTFSSSLNLFLTARVGVAVAISGLQVACFSLLAETIGPKFRIALNVCYGYGWITGVLLLPGIVWLAQDWRKLIIAQACFAVPLLVALPWLYESPRWLVSMGKKAEACDSIRKIARFNRRHVGDVEKEVETMMKAKQHAQQGNISVLGLFQTKYLRRNTTVLIMCSFLSYIVYYGYARTATTLGGNPYMNFAIAAALECLGYTVSLVTTKYLKRIPIMVSSYGFFSVTLLVTAFTPKEYLAVRTTIRMAGWFTYTLGYTTQFVFINEMFPTVARSGGFGLCTTVGRLGAAIEPWINVFLIAWGEQTVLILYSAMLFVITLAMILLPETFGSPLPDTLEEGELYSALKLSKKKRAQRKNGDAYNTVHTEECEEDN